MYFASHHQSNRRREQAGYSLLEITVVVFILGVMAYVVTPDFSPTEQQKLDLAASSVAQALRSARAEAMRTGEVHGLTVSQTTQKVTVKKYDLTTVPVSTESILTHPVEKRAYQFELAEGSLTTNVTISNTQDPFLYSDGGRRKSVLFDASGAPFWFNSSSGVTSQLVDGSIQLGLASQSRKIILAPLSGRVSTP